VRTRAYRLHYYRLGKKLFWTIGSRRHYSGVEQAGILEDAGAEPECLSEGQLWGIGKGYPSHRRRVQKWIIQLKWRVLVNS